MYDLPSSLPWSIMPAWTTSLTFLLGSSTDGAFHRSVRSWSWPALFRAPKSMNLVPELSTTSGGVPPLYRGCSVVEISWVLDSLTSAFGNAFLYSGTCTWVAYWSLYPPAKMTTSSGALGSTPSGFSLLTLPVEPEVLPPPPLLVAQASSRAAPGIATRLAAAALRRRVRRLVPVPTPRGLFGFSGEEGILRSSLVRVVRKPESGVRVHEVIGHVRPAWGRVRRAGGGDPHGSSRAAQWPATARAVAWNAAWARSCVRCATAMYSRSRTTS